MKEIVYIQAGKVSNYIGTHFWNTQESYFTFDDGDEPYVNHDISFREGQTLKVVNGAVEVVAIEDVLIANFGALGRGLYGSEEEEFGTETSQWSGSVDEFRQPVVPKSKYQVQLEEGEDITGLEEDELADRKPEVRYWSDYSRVFYHHRTPQRLPDPPEYQHTDGDWVWGREMFQKYNEEVDLMENSFRFFVEECDNIQGIQVLNDIDSFGSFTHQFLTLFRDEFTKLPCWTFPLLSNCIPGSIDVDDPREIGKALNDALYLQGLSELSTLSIPLQSPGLWSSGSWLNGIDLKQNQVYQTSSILSTHLETVTLPLRLKNSQHTLFSISSTLSMRGNQRFAHLAGVFPLSQHPSRDLSERRYDFSLNSTRAETPFQTSGCLDVSRGFSQPNKGLYSEWRSSWRPEPTYVDAPAIPIPTSFPRYFTPEVTIPSQISCLSTLTTTSRTATLFSQYGKLADQCTKQYGYVVKQMGLEMDDIKELKENLWALEDEYRGEDAELDDLSDSGLGEDEE